MGRGRGGEGEEQEDSRSTVCLVEGAVVCCWAKGLHEVALTTIILPPCRGPQITCLALAAVVMQVVRSATCAMLLGAPGCLQRTSVC